MASKTVYEHEIKNTCCQVKRRSCTFLIFSSHTRTHRRGPSPPANRISPRRRNFSLSRLAGEHGGTNRDRGVSSTADRQGKKDQRARTHNKGCTGSFSSSIQLPSRPNPRPGSFGPTMARPAATPNPRQRIQSHPHRPKRSTPSHSTPTWTRRKMSWPSRMRTIKLPASTHTDRLRTVPHPPARCSDE